MDPEEWIDPAHDYEGEVISVYHHDTRGLIRSLIGHYGSPEKSAIDLGCGVGHFTRLLSSSFGGVHACDYSSEMLAAAERRCRGLDNLRRLDCCCTTLSRGLLALGNPARRVGFAGALLLRYYHLALINLSVAAKVLLLYLKLV